jgi:hypothetical protein
MTHYDVFNGDADGLCALHQLRLAAPRDSVLVTGAKRDIALLRRVAARAGDSVTVLDVSAAVNHAALVGLLELGVAVEYYDHHFPGDLPRHPGLAAWIDTSPDVCTSIIIDRRLGGQYRGWAVAAAFGDNLNAAAEALAADSGLGADETALLRELGECLAYNAYGDSEADLIMAPAALYGVIHRHEDPFAFIRDEQVFLDLVSARRADLAQARGLEPAATHRGGAVYVLPDAAWSRRVRGAFANELAGRFPDRAHALLTRSAAGSYMVSVRAPLTTMTGADAFCRGFAHGGGREAAAGINDLPATDLADFMRRFEAAFP